MAVSKVSETVKKNSTPASAVSYNREEAIGFNKRGLFIGGAAKSGTTLLVSLLDSHPQLVVLPEESFYLEHHDRYQPLTSPTAKLEYLLGQTPLTNLKGRFAPVQATPGPDVRDYNHMDYERFVGMARDFVNQPDTNDSLLFSEMIRAYGITMGMDCQNCVRWVEKTPRSESFPKEMDSLFPGAKMIMMVRDPRAVFASIKNRIVSERGYQIEGHRLTRSWNRSAQEISRLRRDPSRFLVIRYEDLVKNSRETMETVAKFIGLEFSEKMLSPTRAGGSWEGNSAFYKGFSGINAGPVDKWKDYLTEQEIAWIELHCRKGMELANYSFQTQARFSLEDWLKPLPNESWKGYVRARRDSIRQWLGLLQECQYS